MVKFASRLVDPANYTDVLLAAGIMAASAQADDGPAKLVLVNIDTVLDGTQNLDVRYMIGFVDGRPCCVVHGDAEDVDVACIPYFRESGIMLESMKEMKSILAMA